jgi:Family of unknown function (DUF5947)
MTVTPTGLRRFARPQFTGPRAPSGAERAERCELCGEQIGTGMDTAHAHLVDLERRSIACACTPCALLFTQPGGRYRTVPDRVLTDPAAPLTDAEWTELRIPVGLAFFFRNSALGHLVASYPSPAGVTECELDLAAWDRLAAQHPLLRAVAPDVEAILVSSGDGIETFLVPIDVCYSLAGALRRDWHGFDGGDEGRQVIADLLDGLRRRARPVEPAAEPAEPAKATSGPGA